MKLGIISDTHDNMDKVCAAMETFKSRGVTKLIHCGDIIAPFVIKVLADAKFEECFGVFGNNDGEKLWMVKLFKSVGRIEKPPAFINMGDVRIAVLHEPMPDDVMAALPVDIVVFGHTHEPLIRAGKPLIVNPGECGGWLSGRATVAVIDTERMEAELIEV